MPLGIIAFGDAAGGPGTTDVAVPKPEPAFFDVVGTYNARMKKSVKLLSAGGKTVTTAKLVWVKLRANAEKLGPNGMDVPLDSVIADSPALDTLKLPPVVLDVGDNIQARINNGSTAEQNAVVLLVQTPGGQPVNLSAYKKFRQILLAPGVTVTAGAWSDVTCAIPADTLTAQGISKWDLITMEIKGATCVAGRIKSGDQAIYAGVHGCYGVTLTTPKASWVDLENLPEVLIKGIEPTATNLDLQELALGADTSQHVILVFGGY